MEEDGGFGNPMSFLNQPVSEEDKKVLREETERLRALQTHAVEADMVKVRSEAVLMLAQAYAITRKEVGVKNPDIFSAILRVLKTIEPE